MNNVIAIRRFIEDLEKKWTVTITRSSDLNAGQYPLLTVTDATYCKNYNSVLYDEVILRSTIFTSKNPVYY